ncbi:T9SS type A sorting domain-containing protein [Tamlana crocina]
MKKITIKLILFISLTLSSYMVSSQVTAPDEDISSDLSCTPEYTNATRTSSDLPNPVNVGMIDDRSCYADYSESSVYGKTWGVYNITFNSNHLDTSLQPRIERSLSRSQETGVGSYAKFSGTFRILEVGDTSGTGGDGTYIAQAKGKHTGGGGSPDPAICLYLAKPVYGTGTNAGKQVSFDIYAERILFRGGEGSGREIVFLKNVLKDAETSFELEVGFAQDPSDASKKIHYCNAKIGGTDFNWNIPGPERGTESGIRYGAYRVKGGRAQIRWANTTYQKEEVADNSSPGLTGEVYSLKNVATGKFLTDAGAGATPVTMSDSNEAENTRWNFVESGAFYNIDSESYGILRATGSGFSGGAYAVVSTAKAPPASDGDKVWTVHYNESDNTYRLEAGSSGRFIYHEVGGNVTNIEALATDDRSKWQLIAESLSLGDTNFSSSLKVFPNPTNGEFSVTLSNSSKVSVKLYNILGELVLDETISNGKMLIRNDKNLQSGLYLLKVFGDDNREYHSKLVIR